MIRLVVWGRFRGLPVEALARSVGQPVRRRSLRGMPGAWSRKDAADFNRFLSEHQPGVTTLAVDGPVSHRYASLHQALRARGTPIPTSDLWIAALALEHGLVLYTRDAHFTDLPGLACM